MRILKGCRRRGFSDINSARLRRKSHPAKTGWLLELLEGNALPGRCVKHANQNGRNLAALDAACRMERALCVGTCQDTRTIELVDIGCKRIAGLHIGDCIVRDLIDRFLGAFCAVEDVDKLFSRDLSVHLRCSIACIILFDNAVCDCVRNVAVIPVGAAVRQGREHPHICCEYCAIAE